MVYRLRSKHLAFHEKRLADADKAAQMKALSLVISIHIVEYGKGRADRFFRD